MFLNLLPEFESRIEQAEDSFKSAVRYAIVGNIIDFNPIHNTLIEDVNKYFENIHLSELAIDDMDLLINDIKNAKSLLYLGDNCGEICLDKLLLKKIKELKADINLYFGVRKKAVVNDSIAEDAYYVGINDCRGSR